MENKTNKSFIKSLFSRNEIVFGVCFIIIFLFTFSTLYLIGLIPSEFEVSSADDVSLTEQIQNRSLNQNNNQQSLTVVKTEGNKTAERAIRIEAPSISLDTSINYPSSADYMVLDRELARGAVYYPGSGNVENGNMFIFGHSTGYRIVNNKAYQIFNNIHSLKKGDEIYIYTANKKYVYKVSTVRLVDSRESLVKFTNDNRMLTLSTCNSFGAKSDRYVVVAMFDHSI